MTAEESLRIVRRGIAREMVTMRGAREPNVDWFLGYRMGYIRALQSTGKTVKRIINTLAIQQKEGAGE